MIACYGLGVWAFCAAPVVVRGYYALGDRTTPLRTGAMAMLTNAALNLVLVWPLAEAGLALATSLAAMLQVTLLLRCYSRPAGKLGWGEIARTLLRTLAATACMLAAGYAAMVYLPHDFGLGGTFARVAAPIVAGAAAFLAVSRLLKAEELQLLTNAGGSP